MLTISVITGRRVDAAAVDARLRVVATAASAEELTRSEPAPAEVLVVDFATGDYAERLREAARFSDHGRRVLAVGVPEHVLSGADLIGAGVAGLLPAGHDPRRVADAICEVAAHTPPDRPDGPVPRLSGQERVVLIGYASGLTLGATARRAGVRPDTAKKYLERVKQKYADCGRESYTKLDLAVRAREDGLLDGY